MLHLIRRFIIARRVARAQRHYRKAQKKSHTTTSIGRKPSRDGYRLGDS